MFAKVTALSSCSRQTTSKTFSNIAAKKFTTTASRFVLPFSTAKHLAFQLSPSRIAPSQLISRRGLSFKKYKLIEGPPGDVVGSVNDAYVHPEPDYFHGSYHWTYERLVAVALVPLTAAPFAANVDMPLVDTALCTLLLVHAHAGFQSCIIDYIPKRRYGVWHTYAMRLLTLGTAVGFYGVYELETDGPGMFELSSNVWKALSK